MLLSQVKAQPTAIETLRRALAHERLAQAYLFEGPSGTGKRGAAIGLACARNCTASANGCGQCSACKRILSGQHPDVRVFAPRDEGNRNLPVDFVREEILPFTKYAPFEAKTAFVIFPEADVSFPQHHAEAANAILKTIEEPRANVVFLLQSERPSRLLPTIRSRCQKVRFSALPSATLTDILAAQGVTGGAAESAIALSDGSADRALALSEEGRSQAMIDWALRIDAALRKPRPGTLLDLSEELSRSADRDLVLDTLSLFYRDAAAVGLGQVDIIHFRGQEALLRDLAERLSPARAAARVERIAKLMEDLSRNANPGIALDALLFGMP